MLLLKTPNFQINAAGRLLKAGEIAALADAQAILDAAHKEAQEILNASKEEFEKQKQLGYKQGINKGKEEIILQKMGMVESSIQYMEGMEEKMLDLVLKALKKCVEEIGDKEMVVQIIRKAMGAVVRNQQQITIHVSPAMLENVRSRLKEILSNFPTINNADVVEDERLDNMACFLETSAGIVDASIDVQLAAIEKSMRKQFAKDTTRD